VSLLILQLEANSAAKAVSEWHYPRAINPAEIEHAKWFSYGEHLVWWLMPLGHGDWALHLCIEPGHRRRVYGRKLTYAFEILAEILRGDRLLAWLLFTEVEVYVARLGWQREPMLDGVFEGRAWYKLLGG
jgi:hypothetical protein